jgi:hypothetical protein
MMSPRFFTILPLKVSPIMPEEQKNHVKALSTAITVVINKTVRA